MDSVSVSGLPSDTVTPCRGYDNIVSLVVPPDIVMIVPGHTGHHHGKSCNVRENISQPFTTWSSDRNITIKLRLVATPTDSSTASRVTLRDKINYYTLRLSEKFSS